MVDELRLPDLEQIEVFSRWSGFRPPHQEAKLTITPEENRLVRQDVLSGVREPIPAEPVTQLLVQLGQPTVPSLDPTLFDVPEPVIRQHFDSMWTNDNPQCLIRLRFSGGRIINALTTGEHVHLLPVMVRDSAGFMDYKTFNPALSRSMAALMPEGHLLRERLAGACELLQSAIDDYRHGTGVWRIDPDSDSDQSPEPLTEGEGLSIDEVMERLGRMHMGLESPEEKALAERSGRISERLLKRIPLDDVAELLKQGADPNIADENGTTALMLAASPPVDRKKFRMLVRAGADVQARRHGDGAAGLHIACSGGTADAADEWIHAGADINARGPGGATPLMFGAGWLPIVRALLAAGANVHDADEDGDSALVYAIEAQNWIFADQQLAAMQTLIDAGAELGLRDREALTPLGYARRYHRRKLFEDEANRAIAAAWGEEIQPSEEEKQKRLEMTKEMLRDIGSNVDPTKWNYLTMSQAVVDLIASAGGID